MTEENDLMSARFLCLTGSLPRHLVAAAVGLLEALRMWCASYGTATISNAVLSGVGELIDIKKSHIRTIAAALAESGFLIAETGGYRLVDPVRGLAKEPPPTPAARTGFVYFVKASGLGLLKIGFAANVQERISTLQTGSPVDLDLLLAVPGPASLERRFHEKFAHLRQRGEWFTANDELLDYLAEIPLGGPLP